MERIAIAYWANKKLVIASLVQTEHGVGLEIDPIKIDHPLEIYQIEDALREAFSGSGRIVRHPRQDEWKGLFDPFLRAAGVRSLKNFMQGAVRLTIRADNERYEVSAYQNLESKEGFKITPEGNTSFSIEDICGVVSFILNQKPQFPT